MWQQTFSTSLGNSLVVAGETVEQVFSLMQGSLDNVPYIAVIHGKIPSVYVAKVQEQLCGLRVKFLTIAINDDYADKSLANVEYIIANLVQAKFPRNGFLLSLGGGLTSDIVGFVAAIYMRGISWGALPTTLLAQVDAAFGGKTGVDFAGERNLLGCFYPPVLIGVVNQFLYSLPRPQYISGLGELVKYAVAQDKDFFAWQLQYWQQLKDHEPDIIMQAVRRCINLKMQVVCQDIKEQKLRWVLNFGHTFAHALETVTYGKYLHGEAVAIGMLLATKLAIKLNKFSGEQDFEVVQQLLYKLGLPAQWQVNIDLDKFIALLYRDKKSFTGELVFVLPRHIGKVERVIVDNESIVRQLLAEPILLSKKGILI